MNPAASGPTLAAAHEADVTDPLAAHRERFEIPDPRVCYLDGNSLGRPPRAAADTAARVLAEWSNDLVEAWDRWIDRPLAIGDTLAPLLGAGPGQVVMGESTTVALHRAVSGALRARRGRHAIVAARDDFPTDRYVVAELSGDVRWADSTRLDDIARWLGPDVGVVVASAVHFETASIADVGAINAAAHDAGALVVWDCSHAAGVVPLDLDADAVDLAVGCTYKYLHGGPGAPAWTYVAARHHETIRPAVAGWFAQRDQFAMGERFDPLPGPAGWRAGTPGILGLEVAATGIETVALAGIDAIRAKSEALGEVMVAAFDAWFADLGFTLASPRATEARGGHLALRHSDAARIVRAARAERVVADFRAPDLVRLGPGPLSTSFTELTDGLERIRDLVGDGTHERLAHVSSRVT